MRPQILLVEDDRELAPMIVAFLGDEGFDTEWIESGMDAIERIRSGPIPDLVILDVMLPGLSGLDVCRHIQNRYTVPILMLTARDDELTEITSLNRGADGYLTKPVRPHVLLAHIKSILRRVDLSPEVSIPADHKILQVQCITLHPASLAASIDHQALNLTTAEYQLLEYFMRNVGRLVTREEIYQALRGIEYDGLDRSVDMRISVLRKKMGDASPPFRYIKTVRGKGYLLASQ